jgi:tripartite-type tricarboxylate transporter receptor subunit TctC
MMLKDVPYDPIKDFVPVSLIARAPNFLAVHPSVPANSFQEFIALSKEKPGTLNCGSAGNGTIHHLTLEAMKAAFGADIVHVPFKGSGQSVPALIGGQIQCVLAALPALSGFRKTGQAKIIAIASAKRSPLAPDIPAMGEGVPDFNFATIIGVLARVGTPNTAIQRISLETTMIAKDTAVAQALAAMGIEAVGAGAREYAQALLSDAEQMKKAVRAADIKLRQ